MKKTLFTLIIMSGLMFLAGTWQQVFAQNDFKEPTEVLDPDLPFPISVSTNPPQTILGSLGVGVSDVTSVPLPADAELLVVGTMRTVDYVQSASVTVANNLFSLKGATTEQIAIGDPECAGGQVCVKSAADSLFPTVATKHSAGTALYGQTNGGLAGVYGEGHYGVYAWASNSFAIPLVGQSCAEIDGDCLSFGAAGYFAGDIELQNGIFIGGGQKIFNIKSVYNKAEDDTGTLNVRDATTNGIGYESFTLDVAESAVVNIADGDILGIFAVDSIDGGDTYAPAGAGLNITTNGSTTLTVSRTDSNTHKVNVVVSYQLP